jgi:hypothetical protein
MGGRERERGCINARRELAQLMPDHVLGDGHVVVYLAVVHLKLEAYEVGQDRGGARLCPDRLRPLAW